MEICSQVEPAPLRIDYPGGGEGMAACYLYDPQQLDKTA
jgi:hypothetical protein